MIPFQIHSIDSAPEGAQDALRALQANVGFIPNLAATMAESPELLKGFLAVRQLYFTGTFTPAEIEVLSLTAAYENACTWCMAFHTTAAQAQGVSPASITALRAGHAPLEPKLAALSNYARSMVRKRGAVTPEALQRFLDAGYTRAQAMEVILGMAFSLMANYAGHLSDPPLDAPFQSNAWQPARSFAAAR